ncbi:TipC family immunity protein [Gemella sanguinis]|uniref:TipC family immunity protein n=1 Tax=Gemella sanguinis TaxID=84135 RepID=UPI0004E16E32|nr:TipC family immunity protein [Gemella sanguinis]NKZ26703.1 TipC family immunity protein [Gemella sanguinis]
MKKLSKKWKIIIITVVILTGSFYGYYKINNRNAFEEMFNSYYNFVPTTALYNMPQIDPIPRDSRGLEVISLYYKENKNKIEILLANYDDIHSISIHYSVSLLEGVYLLIIYDYDVNTHKLKNYVRFYGDNIPHTKDKEKQTRELVEKYNLSKEQLQKISDEGLDKVLTDWKNYSFSSYSKDNMGRLTIEKDEFLK